jgi:hypothetical protein
MEKGVKLIVHYWDGGCHQRMSFQRLHVGDIFDCFASV